MGKKDRIVNRNGELPQAGEAVYQADQLDPPGEELSPPDLPNEVIIAVPVVALSATAYRPTHLDLHLNSDQSKALRILYDGLAGKQLASGRNIAYVPDAIRYLLDQLHAEYQQAGAC